MKTKICPNCGSISVSDKVCNDCAADLRKAPIIDLSNRSYYNNPQVENVQQDDGRSNRSADEAKKTKVIEKIYFAAIAVLTLSLVCMSISKKKRQ